MIAIDSETKLFSAGCLAPPLVCVSACNDAFETSLYHQLDKNCEDFLYHSFRNEHIVGQNFAYDTCVFAARYPALLADIFAAYFDGRIVDTRLDQRLIDLAQGQLNGYRDSKGVYHKFLYSLNALSQRHGFGEMEKDEYRMRYGEWIDLPLSQWVEGAKKYALDDALRTRQVHGAQTQYSYWLKDSAAQARAAFALQLMSCRGIVTDRRACESFIEATKKEIETAKKLLLEHKILRDTGSKDTKAAKRFMLQSLIDLTNEPVSVEQLENEVKIQCELIDIKAQKFPPQMIEVLDIEVPITKTGGIRLDAEACRDSGSPVLKAYATFTSANTLMEKAETLLMGTQVPLQTSFEVLLETGRISSRAPSKPLIGDNFLNIRTAPGLRECMVPRKGFVWCSIDGNYAELCAWSQIQHWLFGGSKMGDAINAKQDPHCILGADLMGIEYEEMVAHKKEGEYAKHRQLAKIGDFGYLANMGPKKLAASVNKKAKTPADRLTVQLATVIKQKFIRAWDAQPYFDWGRDLTENTGFASLKQFVSERVRGNCNYTQLLNSPFQGLIADALKASLLPISHECYVVKSSPLYGSRILLHLYDEHILELREECAHEAAYRARDIMMEVANNQYLPDVNLSGEPAISRCWTKGADTVFDSNGRLICWEDSSEYKAMMEKKAA